MTSPPVRLGNIMRLWMNSSVICILCILCILTKYEIRGDESEEEEEDEPDISSSAAGKYVEDD